MDRHTAAFRRRGIALVMVLAVATWLGCTAPPGGESQQSTDGTAGGTGGATDGSAGAGPDTVGTTAGGGTDGWTDTGGTAGSGTSGNGGSSDGLPGVNDSLLATLQVFPPENPWNQDISALPVHPNSANYLVSMGLDTGLHPDFGTEWEGAPIGIPFVLVHGDQPKLPVTFDYADESDPGPYPIPPNPPIEGGPGATGDRHVLIIDVDDRLLYELYAAWPVSGGSSAVTAWNAGSGAIFDLNSNALRPPGWTSADAAGLPIFPGLVRYDEAVGRGEIKHALRFTVRRTRRAYIAPARHFASSATDPNLPPMGLRVRLRADFDVMSLPPALQPILRAMQKYGMFVADNGSDWYVSGAPDPRWNDDELRALNQVKGRDFEVVYTGEPATE